MMSGKSNAVANHFIGRLMDIRIALLPILIFLSCFSLRASKLYVGSASVDITPELPVALMGQFHLRIAEEIHTPLKANILVMETRHGGDTVVMVSCDLIWISNGLRDRVRQKINKELPFINEKKVILNGTHTHTAPVIEDLSDEDAYFYYDIPKSGVTQVSEYRDFLIDQISRGIRLAWNNRKVGSTSWGIRRASIGYNRRVVYTNGEAKMYGTANVPHFKEIEGYEDHDIQTLFFWNKDRKLVAACVNVSCPSQENGSRSKVDADFWHGVRQKLQQKFGKQLVVLSWTGAAGDQAPHAIYRKEALERMEKLSNVNRMEDISNRIAEAVIKTERIVRNDIHESVNMEHQMRTISLPKRRIEVSEFIEAKRVFESSKRLIEQDKSNSPKLYVRMKWNESVMNRYEEQRSNINPSMETEIHIIRLGDVAICTNQFELFTDYGIQIQSRSKALQTFVVQLAGQGSYLPTNKAVAGGGYSAVCQSNVVGPSGGDILVYNTLEMINLMFASK